jgi:prepilin-type processing-associated H-X9-DG protein
MASDNVCGPSGDCTAGQLTPVNDIDGLGWAETNKLGNFENINFGQNLTIKGSFPFANSAHPGGGNYAFCDGRVQFLSNTLNGEVYAKTITPGGSKLPIYCKQLPLEQDAISQ